MVPSSLKGAVHVMTWIYRSLPALLVLISICCPYGCNGNVRNTVLTSTPYLLTLSFEPNPSATNYTASFRIFNSWLLNDIALEPPYNVSRLNVSYDNVSPGLNYTVELYENETNKDSVVFSQHISTVPLAPINVKVKDRGTSYLYIAWDSVQNITYSSHQIYFRLENESTWQNEIGRAEEFYTLQGLVSGYLYDVYVTAIAFDFKEDKESLPSSVVSSPTLPAPPTNLSAEAENTTHIVVTWTPQASSYQDSFFVQYLVQGTNATASCQQSPCSFAPGPPAGQEVTIYVSSVSNGVASTAKMTKCSTEPDPVSNLKADEGIRSLNLSWEVPPNADFTSYHIRVVKIADNSTKEYKKDAGKDDSLVFYTLSSLLGGSVYHVFVIAETLYARGEPKTNVFKTVPEPVSGLEGSSVNTTAIQLSWTNPAHTVYDEIIISLLKPDGSVLDLKENKAVESREIGGLIPGETYQISVTVHTPVSPVVSEASNLTITTKPVQPKLALSVSEESKLTVTLTREEDLGVFSHIKAALQPDGNMQMALSNGVVIFDSLTPGTLYTMDMVTISGQEKSDVVSVQLYTKPRPPQSLGIEVLNSSSIRVVWNAPDEGGYDNFTVTVEESEGTSQNQEKTTPEFEVDFTNVMAGTTYNVSIVAVKGDQVSSVVQDQNTTAPLGVSDIRVWIRGIDSMTLTWDPPVRSSLEGYALTFDLSNMTLLELPAATTQYKLEELEPDTNYTIRIFTFALRPTDKVKLYSLPKQFNFSTYPESVAALQKVDASPNSITVNWTDPAVGDFNLYQLGIKEEDSNRQSRPLYLQRTGTNHTFEGLLPGKVYVIAIRTVLRLPSGRQRFGISVRLRAVTRPLPVEGLQVLTVGTSSLQIKWSTNDNSSQDRFLISYEAEGVLKTTEMSASNTSQDYEMPIGQLLSGSGYQVQVVAIRSIPTDSEDSLEALQTGYTSPMSVSNMTLIRGHDNILVTWTAPPSDGKVETYHVYYRYVLRSSDSEFEMSTSTETSKTLVDLFPGEKYEVRVFSVSNDLESEPVEKTILLKPSPPDGLSQNKEKTTTDSVMIGWDYDADGYYSQKWVILYTDGTVTQQVEEMTIDKSKYTKALIGLVPGQTYTVSIYSEVLNETSDVETLTVTAKPVINTVLEEISTTNTSLTFGYTVEESDIFDQFMFAVTPQQINLVYRPKNESVNSVTLQGLVAGTPYSLHAFTRSKLEMSEAVTMGFITDPNPVPVQQTATSREITLTFGSQTGSAAMYAISCMTDTTPRTSCGNKSALPGTSKFVTYSNLTPYSVYHFTVRTLTKEVGDKVKEAAVQYEQQTNQAAPSQVRLNPVRGQSIHSVTLSWQPPQQLNGVLKTYIVSYRGREPNFPTANIHQNAISLPSTQTSKLIQNLKAGYSYTFQVFAKTVADGPPAEQKFTMGTASPTFNSNMSPESSKPIEPESGKDVTKNQISLKFVNPFSTENGFVKYYTVIVSRDLDADDIGTDLPSWEEAKKDSSIRVYQATDKCDDFFATSSTCGVSSSRKRRAAANDLSARVFVVGVQTKAECQGQSFCNGPLSEGTSYYVKLRGFTASGQFQDTAYSERIKTEESSSSNSAGIIGGVIGTLLILAIVAVVVFLVIKRRRRPQKATKHAGPRVNWEQSSMNRFSRPVKLAHFPDHVRKMAADSDFKYAEEYEDLKEVGRDQPTMAAEFPPNRPKNRFTNILPYDHSRVKLLPTDDDEGSDYINANYMPGYNSKREYIATQGPLPATRDDFWRMLWEQCSRNVVMLTRCQEKGREKSDHYWPSDSEPKFYGDLQVVILNETHMPDWTIVEFRVSHGEQSRQVRHFHYRVWPDFGVPKDPASLIRFVRTVREKLIREGAPIIVHCSAGVGRSGTFIVLDNLLQLIREKEEVDVFSIVYSLRKERVLMVQTEQQYKFIHECLLCVLENRESDTTYANLGQINVGFEDLEETDFTNNPNDDEGINLEGP